MSGHRRGSISSADQRSAVLLLVPRALPTSSSSAWSPLPLGGRLCPGWTVVGEPAWWRTIRSGTPVLWTVDHSVRRVLTEGDEQITRTALPRLPACPCRPGDDHAVAAGRDIGGYALRRKGGQPVAGGGGRAAPPAWPLPPDDLH